MLLRTKNQLEDILERIDRINITLGPYRDFFEYEEDWKKQDIVERCLEVIGESMNRILDKEPDIAISHGRKIVGLRNLIIHSYDKISNERIWEVVQRDLPMLKMEINALMEESDKISIEDPT